MVDKLLGKMFKAVDENKAIQKVAQIVVKENKNVAKQEADNTPIDITLCIKHKLKKSFFCEDCGYELCPTCKEWHDNDMKYGNHAVKLVQESSLFVIDKYKESLDKLNDCRYKIREALKIDPTTMPLPDGQLCIISQGEKEIDRIFEKLQQELESTKLEMKERLKQAYIQNYRI